MLGGAPSNKKKWDTLEHNGVMFYPEYVPHNIPITYKEDLSTQIIHLNPTAEEFITYYVNKRFDKYRNDKFNKNFFNDWKTTLNSDIRKKIKDFSKCNFDDIKAYVEGIHGGPIVPEDASSRKLKIINTIIAMTKAALKNHKEDYDRFMLTIDKAKGLTQRKRYYYSDYGFSNFKDVVLGKADKLIPNPEVSISQGAIRGWDRQRPYYYTMLQKVADHFDIPLDTPWNQLDKETQKKFLQGTGKEKIDLSYIDERGRKHNRVQPFEGILPHLERRYRETESNYVRDE